MSFHCCRPRAEWRRMTRPGGRRFLMRKNRYASLRDDEDCQWLMGLACQPTDSFDNPNLLETKNGHIGSSLPRLGDEDGSIHFSDVFHTEFSNNLFTKKTLSPPSDSGESDTEEEEDSSSSMDLFRPAVMGDSANDEDEASTASSSDLKSISSRSIRFADEVEGQHLETIHSVPWSEHNDEMWTPRRVRCRVEL